METISREKFFEMWSNIEKRFIPSEKLDIGSGGVVEGWQTIDKSHKGETWSFDIRTQFAPVYNKQGIKLPFRQNVKPFTNKFFLVRMQHIVEHVEWIYQKFMFDWVHSIMGLDSYLFVETPNVDWVIEEYIKGANHSSDHPDIKDDDSCKLIKWLNFKLYSGCSTNNYKDGCVDGDFHLCMYNKQLLEQVLYESKFSIKAISVGDTLLCLAHKVIRSD